MSESIHPALTADDWHDAREIGELQLFVMNAAGIPAHLLPAQHGHRPGMMLALANYVLPDGHPLKITQEDVAALLATIEEACANGNTSETDCIALSQTLAAKLAALLPPAPT